MSTQTTPTTNGTKAVRTRRKSAKLLPDYHPETIDELMWSPYYCDDCDTWHDNYVGLEIDNGDILNVSCDTDGNWDHDGTGDRATSKAYERLNRELMEQCERSEKDYLQYCAETGDDPLHNFYLARTTKRKERWQARFTPWLGLAKHGFAVTEIMRGKSWYAPKDAPEHVSRFMHLHKVGDRYCMEGITSLDNIMNAKVTNPTMIRFTLEREQPRPTAIVTREIKQIAKRSLRRFK